MLIVYLLNRTCQKRDISSDDFFRCSREENRVTDKQVQESEHELNGNQENRKDDENIRSQLRFYSLSFNDNK
jgi:hypothetical protein